MGSDNQFNFFLDYLREDVAGPGHLASFMLHSGPKVEEMVTSVSFVHGEVAKAAMKPSLLNSSIHPVDMVMVPDGDPETIQILTKFLYGSADSAIIISTAQAAIVGNVLSNLLGASSSALLQELVVDSTGLYSNAELPEDNVVVQEWPEEIVVQEEEIVVQEEEAVVQEEEAVVQEEILVHLQELEIGEEVKGETVKEVWVETVAVESPHGYAPEHQVGGVEQPQVLWVKS
jgi:hypothetical protein